MFDLIIIGGGPSGSTLARLLGNKYKILVLEKRDLKRMNIVTNQKCCGGLLAPDAQKMLALFGLGLPKTVLLSPQLFAVRTIDIKNNIERYFQRHYININREEFDKWLLDLAAMKAEVRTNCIFHSFKEENDEITVNYSCNGNKFSEKTRILIGADGGFSKIRRLAFPYAKMPKKYISIQEWFEIQEDMPYYGAIFDDEITDFYSWTIPKENCLIVGTALEIDESINKKFELLKEKLKNYGYNLGKSVKRNGAFILRPENIKQLYTGKGNIALIGEAAGFISPSSAEGISYAFKSALALAKVLEYGVEGFNPRYKKASVHIYRNISLKRLKSPAMYNSFIRKQILKTGVLSLNKPSC